jgi:hypothetical protein
MAAARGMLSARIAAVLVLVVSYGALSARQPAVRTSIPLPSGAAQLAASLGLAPADRHQLLTSIVRVVFEAPDGSNAAVQKRRAVLSAQLKGSVAVWPLRVPLPLDTSIWRETILGYPVKDGELAAAILSDRSTALLYYGLTSLDDDTLGWLGPDRETLLHLRRNAAPFASFSRSIRVRGGRVAVPGGRNAEPIWAAIVGADPGRPSLFVQRLLRGSGRLAWFYDTVQQLDPAHQRLVFGDDESEAVRIERTRSLLDVFESAAPEWKIPDRPFVRPALDPSVVLSLAAVNDDGRLIGPDRRRVWELVFRDRGGEASIADLTGDQAADARIVEPSWLARRISLVPVHLGRARLDTFLFAQRRFPARRADDATTIAALRGAMAFPALALTLERLGIVDAAAYAAAARTAVALNAIRSPEWRAVAIVEFQAALAIADRAVRKGELQRDEAAAVTASLVALPVSANQGYGEPFVQWVREHLIAMLDEDQQSAVRDALLARPTDAETDTGRLPAERTVAETLKGVVYSMYLHGSDGGAAVDIAARHSFGLPDSPMARAWQLPREEHAQRGPWRISGSLLGLDGALGRLPAPLATVNSRP